MQEANHYKALPIKEVNQVMWVTMNRPDALNALNILITEQLTGLFHGLLVSTTLLTIRQRLH